MIGMTRTTTATSIQGSELRVRVELVQPMRLVPVGAASRAAAGRVLGLLLVEPLVFAPVGAAGAELSTLGSTSGSWAKSASRSSQAVPPCSLSSATLATTSGRSGRVCDAAGDHVAHVAGCEAVGREATEVVDFPKHPHRYRVPARSAPWACLWGGSSR
jgi:hypothetical protein